MADVAAEECGDEIDTVVGISINGVLFANEVANQLGCEIAIHRNVDGAPGHGSLSNKYGQVSKRSMGELQLGMQTQAVWKIDGSCSAGPRNWHWPE